MSSRDVRKPPLPEIFLRYHPLGECRWCGKPIFKPNNPCEFASRRNWHDGRVGESDCLGEYLFLTRPAIQRAFVWERDRGICYICGRAPGLRLVKPYGDRPVVALSGFGKHAERTEYVEVRWEPDWQLEHKTPLWSVAHLPDIERLQYFQPGNLGIACTRPCAEEKTRREAAARGKVRRIKLKGGLRTKAKNAKERAIERMQRYRDMP